MFTHPLLFGSILILISTLIGGCYRHYQTSSDVSATQAEFALERKIENIVYTEAGWPRALSADLYLPQKRGPKPVVLMVHGGSWASRGREDMVSVSLKLSRRGYAVFNISYRFAPRFTYPAQLHDLQQALQWITANARRYDLDISRINSWGYSSGAHLAALIGGLDASGDLRQLPKIRAVVAGGIPSDLRKYDDSPIVERFLGGRLDQMPTRYAEASPAAHISTDDPPVFLYHGNLDRLVTPDQAQDYHAALLAAGVESELYLHRWYGHLTMFLFGGDAENKAIEFLDRHNLMQNIARAGY